MEKVDGPQGALTHIWSLDTDVSPAPTIKLYYEDNDVNPVHRRCRSARLERVLDHQRAAQHRPARGRIVEPARDPDNLYEAPGRTQFDALRHAHQVRRAVGAVAG